MRTAIETAKPRDSEGKTPTCGTVHTIGIAAIRCVRAPDRLRTVLGSCIGIVLYDLRARIGAMGHVILPSSLEGEGDPGKFADTAVDELLRMLLAEGAERQRISAKIAGGAAMFGIESASALGARNADAVRTRLDHHAIPLMGSAIGGDKGRRIILDPATGEVYVDVIGESTCTL